MQNAYVLESKIQRGKPPENAGSLSDKCIPDLQVPTN